MEYYRCKDCQNYVGTLYELVDHKLNEHSDSVCERCGVDENIFNILWQIYINDRELTLKPPKKCTSAYPKDSEKSEIEAAPKTTDTPKKDTIQDTSNATNHNIDDVIDSFVKNNMRRTNQLSDDKKTKKYVTLAAAYSKFQETLVGKNIMVDRQQFDKNVKDKFDWGELRKRKYPTLALFGVEFIDFPVSKK